MIRKALTSRALLTLTIAAMGSGLGAATPKAGDYVAFVTCPLLRDTPELPCWMARYKGRLYYLGIQEGRTHLSTWYQPQMKHKMLVQGVVAARPDVCGGVPLDRMTVSDLPEVSPECDTKMLPTQGFVSPKGRPLGPDPSSVGGPQVLRGPAPGAPELYTKADIAARRALRFDVHYNFDSDFLIFPQEQNRVVQLKEYVQAIGAREIRMTAHRASALLTGGKVIVENAAIPANRRDNIVTVLKAIGVPVDIIKSEVLTTPEPARGLGDNLGQRVDIEVIP